MENARTTLIALAAGIVLAACGRFDAPERSYVSDQRFTEPTFFSVQPVAYPHPVGCERCGFPTRLGLPEQ